jgi:hypothetical protein
VAIPRATFPASQRLAQRTHLVITVRNAGARTIPDIAASICNVTCDYPAPRGQASSAQAFAEDLAAPYLADPSRPVWIIDRPPGACRFSCPSGGPGGAVTAYTNTWALGSLAPGSTARFDWAVTAVTPGRHVVAWQIAAGLTGNARAVLANGLTPQGRFGITISSAPQRSYVNARGQVVKIGP